MLTPFGQKNEIIHLFYLALSDCIKCNFYFNFCSCNCNHFMIFSKIEMQFTIYPAMYTLSSEALILYLLIFWLWYEHDEAGHLQVLYWPFHNILNNAIKWYCNSKRYLLILYWQDRYIQNPTCLFTIMLLFLFTIINIKEINSFACDAFFQNLHCFEVLVWSANYSQMIATFLSFL